MKRTAFWTAIAAVVVALLIVLAGVDLAGADSSTSPSPSPTTSLTATPTPSPTVTPASAELVRWALDRRRVAHRRWAKWDRARHCFELPSRTFRPQAPARGDSAEVWTKAGKAWKANGRDYLERFRRLRREMKHPGGPSSGIRWMPLARWVGWPEYTLSTLAPLIMNESSGMERSFNRAYPYCKGLLQLYFGFYRGLVKIRGVAERFNPWDAETNLRKSLGIWLDQHCSFKPAWRGDPAVGY